MRIDLHGAAALSPTDALLMVLSAYDLELWGPEHELVRSRTLNDLYMARCRIIRAAASTSIRVGRAMSEAARHHGWNEV